MSSSRADSSRALSVVSLTGGPGGGKSTLLARLAQEPGLAEAVVVMEESIHAMRFVRLPPRTPEFQCALVATQAATEDTLQRALAGTEKRLLVTHRGTLDPCAFWQSFGHSRGRFFEMTGTCLADHYQRYDLVLHLETAARRVPGAYVRYPQAHRPEDLEAATWLDVLLEELWSGHPRYFKVASRPDLEDKLEEAVGYLRHHLPAATGPA